MNGSGDAPVLASVILWLTAKQPLIWQATPQQKALSQAGLAPLDIDLIIVATTTPDNTFPSTATKVQYLIGASGAIAFDVQAVCAGFIYALMLLMQCCEGGGGAVPW